MVVDLIGLSNYLNVEGQKGSGIFLFCCLDTWGIRKTVGTSEKEDAWERGRMVLKEVGGRGNHFQLCSV